MGRCKLVEPCECRSRPRFVENFKGSPMHRWRVRCWCGIEGRPASSTRLAAQAWVAALIARKLEGAPPTIWGIDPGTGERVVQHRR